MNHGIRHLDTGWEAIDQINTISQPRRYRLTATSCRHARSSVFEQ